MAPRSAKEHLAAEEVSYECSHNRCCKKWHSSHGKPLKYSMDPVHEHHRHLSGAATPTGGFAAEAVPPWLCSGVTGMGRMKLKAT